MKRITTAIAAVALLFGLVAAAPVSAARNIPSPNGAAAQINRDVQIYRSSVIINGCGDLGTWPPTAGNGLYWSRNYLAFRTPMVRAGTCRHVYVKSLGVANTTSGCSYIRVDTHNDDGSRRVTGPWVRFNTNQIKDMRYPIDANRLFLVLAYSCDHRDGSHWTGFTVYAI
jgi:hypothetical protein